MPSHVHLQISETQVFCLSLGSTAQYRAHSCEQLRKCERLDQIIVCAQLESFHPVAHTVTRGQKKNGRANAIAPKFCNHFPAVLVREHDIDNQKIKLARASLRQPGFSIDCNIYRETGFPQSLGQERHGFFFVFDYENPHCGKWDLFSVSSTIAPGKKALQSRGRQAEM